VPAATIKAPGLHYYLSAQGCRAVLMSLSRRARSEFSPAAAMVEMDLMRGLIAGLLIGNCPVASNFIISIMRPAAARG
jgi:hypothetical protein